MYEKVTCRIRDKIEVSKHYCWRYGAPGMTRAEKKTPTPDEMARQNHWRRVRDLRRLIELNFGPGDWHVTLTCRPEERPSAEEAPKVIRKFLGQLRREYRKRGWELRYIVTCETGERGAVHWHMITSNLHDRETDSAKLIRDCWKRGRTYFSPLEESGDYSKLAEYIVKEASRRIEKGETIEKMSYSRSRNLKKPVERREKVRAKGWRLEPRIPSGWELVEGSLLNGRNHFTGLLYQHYTIRRKEEGSGSKSVYRHKPERAAPGKKDLSVHSGGSDGEGNRGCRKQSGGGGCHGKPGNAEGTK